MESNLYKLSGFWWRCYDRYISTAQFRNIDGPFCLSCYCELEFPDDVNESPYVYNWDETWTGKITCNNCGKVYELRSPLKEIKIMVASKLKAGYLSKLNKISLDEPITSIKVRDQDDKYFLAATIGQKDGKRVGVVYFGEKNKDQNKKDYSQIFIDIDDEQLRFDKSNMIPKDILTKMNVEFKDTKAEIKYKKK